MPEIKAAAPSGLHVELHFEQSLFVRVAVQGVAFESVRAGLLTARSCCRS